MKKIRILVLSLVMVTFLSVQTFADNDNIPKVKVDGVKLEFDVPAKNIEGRVLVPLRKIFETLGANVKWDGETKTVTATKEDKSIKVRIDDTNASINDENIKLDVPPKIFEGRTLVPVRFISESFGCEVHWDGENKTVFIDNLVVFKDEVLESAIKSIIRKKEGNITRRAVSKVQFLELSNYGISDLTGISDFVNLSNLIIENNKIIDISHLSSLLKLRKLDISKNQIKDLRPLVKLTNLEELNISNNQIKDIRPLVNLNNLKLLEIQKNLITDYSTLDKVPNIDRNQYEKITFKDEKIEIAIRKEINKPHGDINKNDVLSIQELNISKGNITEIEDLGYLTNLTKLYLHDNEIKNVKHLSKLNKLEELYLYQNKIEDISSLSNLTKLEILYLWGNNIKDISKISYLKKLKILSMGSNLIEDVEPLSKLSNLTDLYLDSNKIRNANPLKNLKNLQVLNIYPNYQLVEFSELKELSDIKTLHLWGIKEPKQVFKKIRLVEEKSNSIIAELINENMSDYEKALVIHDYIVAKTAYDSENYNKDTIPSESYQPFEVLLKGIGVCSGYSQAYNILLNKAGVESEEIEGEGFGSKGWEGHSWNLIKLEGKYYHVDPTHNDPVSEDKTQTIRHDYFAVSDKQVSISHKWDKSEYEKCSTDNITLVEDSYYKSIIAGENIYFNSDEKLFKKESEKDEKVKIIDDNPAYLCSDGDWIYYANQSDEFKLYKIRLDGTKRTKMSNDNVSHIYNEQKYLYYIANSVGMVRKNKETNKQKILINDGTISSMIVDSGYIYYTSFDWRVKIGRLYKVNLNGNNRELLTNDKISGYTLTTDGNFVNWSYNQKIFKKDDYIFYSNESDKHSLYKVRINKNENIKLNSDKTVIQEILDDYIYYKTDNNYYRIKADGSGRQLLQK